MSDVDQWLHRQKLNTFQQTWGVFSDVLDSLDPPFESFAKEYSYLGWTFQRNLNRMPQRQISREELTVDGKIWFCMGVDLPGHWYRTCLSENTLFEFEVVAKYSLPTGQSLVQRGFLLEPAPILTLVSRLESLLEEGQNLSCTWTLPENRRYRVGEFIDGWEAGPYFPQR